MKRRHVIFPIVTLLIVVGGVAAWYVFLVIEPFKSSGFSSGSIDEGKPWHTSEIGQPFEGARLVAQYFDVYRVDHGAPASHNWLYQVLIVFPKDSAAEHRGGGCGSFGAHSDGKELGLRPHWRYRFDGGEDQRNSISILCKDIEDEKWMLIENRRFQLRQGNLFCVILNKDMEFDSVVQLNETITRKATIADFKRLLPDNAAVQAIKVFGSGKNPADRHDDSAAESLGGHTGPTKGNG